MRVCVVYDCLFPWTVGGAERWYRNLAERLAARGHDVTYLTLRQWDRGVNPSYAGVRVISVGPKMALYTGHRRRIAPPLAFGAGVLWHLLRHGSDYDVVHTASFPYFSLLAAGLLRRWCGYRIVVDWFEVWSSEYWRDYLGPVGGAVGHAVQALCMRLPQRAFCFSQLYTERLRAGGLRGPAIPLHGLYPGELQASEPLPAEPLVVFAGRHIPEKQVPALVPAVGMARRTIPDLRAAIFGDGPERGRVLDAIAREGLDGVVRAPGFVDSAEIEEALRRALCMVLPSRREGYGMIVVEAAAHGTPSVVVRGIDNAAVELIDHGENGVIAASTAPGDLAAAIERVHAAGPGLRRRTRAWFARNAPRLSMTSSLELVVAGYAGAAKRDVRLGHR